MNAKERDEWIKAVAACQPGSDAGPLLAAAAAVDGPGRWEVSVSGAGLHRVGLRFFGRDDHRGRLEAVRKAFSIDEPGPAAPPEGFPWLAAAWDLKTGRWTALRLCGAARARTLAWDFRGDGSRAPARTLSPAPFKGGLFGEPALDRALDEFARLSPLSSASIEGSGWSLRLEQPLRWPLFASRDFSAAFTPSSSQRALFMLDRSVVELSFDGEALWAHCAG